MAWGALDTRKDWTQSHLKIQRTSQGYSNLLALSPCSFYWGSHDITLETSADFNLPHQEAWWLYNSCIHIIRVPGWLTLITLWLHFFSPPLQDGYCSEPTSFFQKVNIARRAFGNCLAICQEPDDLQQWTNAHNKETWLDYQLATSTSGGWLERREKMVFSLGKYQEGFIILMEASAQHIRPPPSHSKGTSLSWCKSELVMQTLGYCVWTTEAPLCQREARNWLTCVCF